MANNLTLEFRILNDDFPGVFSFEKRGYFVKESCGHVAIVIVRENGADGDVQVQRENNP